MVFVPLQKTTFPSLCDVSVLVILMNSPEQHKSNSRLPGISRFWYLSNKPLKKLIKKGKRGKIYHQVFFLLRPERSAMINSAPITAVTGNHTRMGDVGVGRGSGEGCTSTVVVPAATVIGA
jgi:hypothetical protein